MTSTRRSRGNFSTHIDVVECVDVDKSRSDGVNIDILRGPHSNRTCQFRPLFTDPHSPPSTSTLLPTSSNNQPE